MNRLSAVAAACAAAALSGCALIAGGAGGGIGGYLAGRLSNPIQDADTAVAIAKPLNEGLCTIEPWRPHSLEIQAAISAFCENLPSTPAGIIKQGAAIYAAIEAERQASAPPPVAQP